jgi:isopenicillin-N N-acyltransferase-like protein
VLVVEIGDDDVRAQGLAYGVAVAHVVPALWASYLTLFERRAGVSESRALRAGEAVLGLVHGWRPALVEEMEGVAAGSGMPVEVIAALNARSEIVTGAECTTVGRAGPARPWLAQNWDWFTDVPERCVLVIRPGFTTFTESGILAKVGLSATGLALTLNMLIHEGDRRATLGVPAHLLIREILGSCRSVAEAVELATSVPVSASFCLTIVSSEGDAAIIEVTPAGVGRLDPDGDGLLAHANLLEAPALAGGDRGPDAAASTARLAALRRDRPQSLDEARAALASHIDGPGSICRHGEVQPDGLPTAAPSPPSSWTR